MYRAVIIDDNNNSRVTLMHDLEKYCPQVKIIGEADSVASGISIIEDRKPDVVFLDIQMSDGTGFDILEHFGKIDFHVIFTTAFDSYGIKAIKFSALDYLLKPIDTEELVDAVKKLDNFKVKEDFNGSINLLLENIRNIQTTGKRIALNSSDRIHMIQVSDIIRCESQGSYTIFYLTNKEQIVATRNLKEYEQLLEEHSFIRVHHSHLINFNYLKEFIKKDGGYAIMKDNTQVPVSFRKRNHLLEMLEG
ncbi:MAG: response regulator transcription factor [Bacteroidales bacterium]|nr:response regulator transcription factor [Bacteroidales bacterium]